MGREGIPVQSHIGLIPTFSHHYGRLRAFGRTSEEAMQVWDTLKRMEDVGVFAVEVDCLAEEVLLAVNNKTSVVTFSLGSGMGGDAIFSYVADVCGEASEEEKPPKHAHAFGRVGRLHKQIHDELESGMVICVESYIGEIGGVEGVKLEDMVLVTDSGPITLSRYFFEEDLLTKEI